MRWSNICVMYKIEKEVGGGEGSKNRFKDRPDFLLKSTASTFNVNPGRQ